MSADQLKASRAILYWAAKTKRILWREYNALMTDVVRRERLLIGCNGKEAFLTFEHAMRVANRPGKDGHKHRKVFHCALCQFWHLASIHKPAKVLTLKYREKRAAFV